MYEEILTIYNYNRRVDFALSDRSLMNYKPQNRNRSGIHWTTQSSKRQILHIVPQPREARLPQGVESDPRSIVLYGLSAGGMLTYHTAALNEKVKGIVGMTFLDQRIQQVRDETARNPFMSRVGVLMAGLSDIPLLRSFSLPMSLASKMSTLVNHPAALKVFMADRSSAASWAPMHFLSSYSSNSQPLSLRTLMSVLFS
ncbi:uncharacterized protein N7473_002531 [Penicillium subrubescens]|uniref:uncharacterized protein n=1 Tax=Penicillium subrubescens TaxID=1316194 RepID=UPI0025457DF6|nr:uncharacterized protein N7473_002531 [Penicillium subrubescens]KAJ5905615.1 hypothetical protein N7473_002531 [Penicillium subrubescens]